MSPALQSLLDFAKVVSLLPRDTSVATLERAADILTRHKEVVEEQLHAEERTQVCTRVTVGKKTWILEAP